MKILKVIAIDTFWLIVAALTGLGLGVAYKALRWYLI